MANITEEVIAVNRYAPRGANAVSLYATDFASSLTLGQLVVAVSMRSAAAYEHQSVLKMNIMASGSQTLERAAEYMQTISDGTAEWSTAKNYLINTLGVTDSLPDDINTFDKRMAAIAALKAKVDAITQSQQEQMIDLQTCVNRRDVAYSASSNIIRALGNSQAGNAENY